MSEPTSANLHDDASARDPTSLLLETHLLTRTFRTRGGSVTAVDRVNLGVSRGETVALVGETGCGKSTLGRLLVNLLSPSSGWVRFEGADLSNLSGRELRTKRSGAQMVFQDPLDSLDPRWPARRSIAEPLKAYHWGTKTQIAARVTELLDTVGLSNDLAARLPSEMSGGQRQRVGIARALALEPKLVVTDEPVSALDVSIQAQIVNLLIDIQSRLNVAYVFIAHGLEVVRHISDRVGVMYRGSLVELAPTSAVFERPMHPYTDSLLAAVPRPDPRTRSQLRVLPGEVGSLVHVPQGCRFHPRCPASQEICARLDPPSRELRDGHFVSCHFPLNLDTLPPSPVTPTSRRPDLGQSELQRQSTPCTDHHHEGDPS